MLYEEPVACLGAIVANQLIIDRNSKAKPFAIFDLGGGTLDTAFGIFRPARDSELDFADFTIQIFGCGGNERVGGEKLIHRLAYKIYLDNRDLMIQHNIPFVLPSGERFPQGLDGLLSVAGDDIANANVATLKENIARILFHFTNRIDNQINLIFEHDLTHDANHCKISLRDTADDIVHDLDLEIVNVDDFLRDTISDIVDGFKSEMDNICSTDKIIAQLCAAGCDGYRPQDFTILLAGNASKQYYVEQIMRERFGVNRIERIHNVKAVSDDNFSDRYKLNGKSAVAFGQKLNNYFVDRSAYQIADKANAPFQYCVGYEDPGNGEFVPVIVPNDNSRQWKRANRITVQHQSNLPVTAEAQYSAETLRAFNRSVIVDKDVKSRRP